MDYLLQSTPPWASWQSIPTHTCIIVFHHHDRYGVWQGHSVGSPDFNYVSRQVYIVRKIMSSSFCVKVHWILVFLPAIDRRMTQSTVIRKIVGESKQPWRTQVPQTSVLSVSHHQLLDTWHLRIVAGWWWQTLVEWCIRLQMTSLEVDEDWV